MYCKLFASLYQGTLRGKSDEILVFTNLLAHCGVNGTVDKHFRAIAEETGLPIERVKAAIEVLESPDPESRSPEEEGARIVRLDEHRVWGWQVVNYGKYRAIRSEDDRAEQNRLAQQRWREKHKKSKPTSAEGKQDKPKEREREKEEGEEFHSLEPLPKGCGRRKPSGWPSSESQAREMAEQAGVASNLAATFWQHYDGMGYWPQGNFVSAMKAKQGFRAQDLADKTVVAEAGRAAWAEESESKPRTMKL